MGLTIELSGVDTLFEPIYYEEFNRKIKLDDDELLDTSRAKIIVNEEYRQSILFYEARFEHEEQLEDICDIANYSTPEAYDYITKILNTEVNVTIFWSQMLDTTSDFIIIHDHYFKTREEIEEYLGKYCKYIHMKYIEIINDKERICDVRK